VEEKALYELLGTNAFRDLLDTLDKDKPRASKRAATRGRRDTMMEEFQDNTEDLHLYAIDNTEDAGDWPADEASRVTMPSPAVPFDLLLELEQWPGTYAAAASPAVEALHTASARSLALITKRMHALEWQLRQLRRSAAEAHEVGTASYSGRPTGKTPPFVSLLSSELREYPNDSPPLALARHIREETTAQRDVREQRDRAWRQIEHCWTRDNQVCLHIFFLCHAYTYTYTFL
jgi:hypothetical protein